MNKIYDLNNLYKAYRSSKKNSDWKPEVQKYEMNWLTELSALQKELSEREYRTAKGTEFTISERGKTRRIVGSRMRDRVVRHSLCDNSLTPAVDRYLIYDNAASRKGKGTTFARKRLLKHLRSYYNHHGNEGYILLMDFSKYYDNIRHDIVREMFTGKVDDNAMWLLDLILNDFEVDVSYMTDRQYTDCMNTCYNSIEAPKCTEGKRFMKKSVNIGDQTSQVISIYYPLKIDNFVKIVCGMKYYGRYMDDSYIISDRKERLKEILGRVRKISEELGIFINEKKTQIVKLSKGFRYLQNYYTISRSGRITAKINPKHLTAMRRKMKKLAAKIILGELKVNVLVDLFKSWLKNYCKIMSGKQRANLCKLYNDLMEMIQNDNNIKRRHCD